MGFNTGLNVSLTAMFAEAAASALPVFSITKVYVSVPFSVTVVGVTAFDIESFGVPFTVTVYVTVIGVLMPSPLTVAVLTIGPPDARGAYSVTSAL